MLCGWRGSAASRVEAPPTWEDRAQGRDQGKALRLPDRKQADRETKPNSSSGRIETLPSREKRVSVLRRSHRAAESKPRASGLSLHPNATRLAAESRWQYCH